MGQVIEKCIGLKGEGKKGMQRMPRWQAAKKGVVSCEKPGGAARERRYRDTRMGKPAWERSHAHKSETRGSETSQYPEEKKSNEIPQVEAIERGRA